MPIVEKKMWYISAQHKQHFNLKKCILSLQRVSLKSKRYYNQTQSFWTKNYSNTRSLSSYIREIKKTTTLVWETSRTSPLYANITQRCSLCLHDKLVILMYPNQSQLLNKRSELVSKCQDENKFLLQTFNSNDWSRYLYSLMSSSQLK